ncbi:MAG: Fur family transcriptional regulator [Oscillospiraceae bacterium]|jgi:Fur family ferric uptake transcriptional regulator
MEKIPEKCLSESGLKKTKQRTAILEILESSEQPVSAEEVFIELSGQKITASLSTVYRSLETMADKGVLTKLNLTGEKALFEINCMVHRHYLTCLGCKKIVPINHCPIESYEKTLGEQTGFVVVSHKLHVFGYCPDCQKKGLHLTKRQSV